MLPSTHAPGPQVPATRCHGRKDSQRSSVLQHTREANKNICTRLCAFRQPKWKIRQKARASFLDDNEKHGTPSYYAVGLQATPGFIIPVMRDFPACYFANVQRYPPTSTRYFEYLCKREFKIYIISKYVGNASISPQHIASQNQLQNRTVATKSESWSFSTTVNSYGFRQTILRFRVRTTSIN